MKVYFRNTKNIFTIFGVENEKIENLIVINRNKRVIMRDGYALLKLNDEAVIKVDKILKEHSGVDCNLESLKFCLMNRIMVNRKYFVVKPKAYSDLLHRVSFKTVDDKDFMYVYGVPYLILDTFNMELFIKRGFFSDDMEMILRAATNQDKCPFTYDDIYNGLEEGHVYDYKIVRG